MTTRTRARAVLVVVASFALAFTAVGYARGQLQRAPGRSALSGVVLDERTRAPVPGAVVTVKSSGFRGAVLVADGLGRFAFADLPPGHYTVSAQKVGYFDGLLGEAALPKNPIELLWGLDNRRRLVLVEGQWFDEAVVYLRRPASISGVVSNERRQPAPGRVVHVLGLGPTDGASPTLAGAAVTDETGHFSVGRLLAGTYVLAVLPVNQDGSFVLSGDGAAYPLTYYPAALSMGEATPVNLAYGDDLANLDFTLAPLPTGNIVGHIIATDTMPAGLQVALTPLGDPVGLPSSQIRHAAVSPLGTFSLGQVPSGRYSLALAERTAQPVPGMQRPEGPRPWSSSNQPGQGSAPGSLRFWGRTVLTVSGGRSTRVALNVKPAAVVAGQVTVTDTGDSPAALPRSVALIPLSSVSRTIHRAQVQEDGSFRFDAVLPGDYHLGIVGAVYAVSSNGVAMRGPVRVTDDTREVSIEATTGPGARITGTVRPMPPLREGSLTVIYFPPDRTLWREPAVPPSRIGRVAVATDGRFESPATVPPGRYMVMAVPESVAALLRNDESLMAAAARALSIDVAAGRDVHLELEPSGLRGG